MDLKKFKKSFGHALDGINYALNHDQNLVIHFIVAFTIIIASIFLGLTAFEMGLLGVTMLVVIISEMLNTSIEKVIDLITREHHVSAKIAKDVASGMVLLTAIGASLIGILVFLPHVLQLFR